MVKFDKILWFLLCVLFAGGFYAARAGENASAAAAVEPVRVAVGLRFDGGSLPEYVFGVNRQTLVFAVSQKYGAKVPQTFKFTILGAGEYLLSEKEKELTVPAYGQGSAELRLTIDFSRLPLPALLCVRAENKKMQGDFPLASFFPVDNVGAPGRRFTVFNPVSQKEETLAPSAGGAAAGKPAVYCLPAFDETRLRRWKPLQELLRVGNWLGKRELWVFAEDYAKDGENIMSAALQTLASRGGADVTLFRRGADLPALFRQAAGVAGGTPETALFPRTLHLYPVLFFIGTAELAQGVPTEVFRSQVEAVLTLLQHEPGRRVYLAGPPPYPARAELRREYSAALAEICEKRHCFYIGLGEDDADFITSAAPAEMQKEMGEKIAKAVSFAPGPIVFVFIPFIILSAAFWWLRSFSRFSPKNL